MSASGTTTLGFILWTIAVSLLVWIFGVLYNWRKQQRSATARSNLFQLFASSVSTPLITLAAIAVVTLGTWTVFVVRTIYFDHMDPRVRMQLTFSETPSLGTFWSFTAIVSRPLTPCSQI